MALGDRRFGFEGSSGAGIGGGFSLGGGGSPLAPSIIEYTPPEYDEGQIRAYQQEALAPGVSGLRRVMREAQAGRYSSPSARREALRGAYQGYGEALAPLQVGAGRQARQRYDIQYQQQILAERQRVAAEERRQELEYQQALREYEEGGSTQGATGGAAQGGGGVSRHRAFQYIPPTQYNEVSGLTQASRRPISEPSYDLTGGGLGQPAQPAAGFPTDWMNIA